MLASWVLAALLLLLPNALLPLDAACQSPGSAGAPGAAEPPAAAPELPSAAPEPSPAGPEPPAAAPEPPVTTRLVDQEAFEAAAAGKRIRTVHIVTENIFDPSRPGERRRLFHLVNRLHRTTRPEVIEHQLLFRPGDPYSPETLRESERLLRANRYLYAATIRPVAEDGGGVDLEVLTRDVWTLQAGLDFRRAGGTNSTAFDLEDENLLGTGKDLEVARLENVDRTSKLLRYRDPALDGTHGRLDLTVADNSDGDTRIAIVERPFYALDTRWALGVSALHDLRIDPLYDAGDVVDRFRQRHDFLEIYWGLSPGLLDGVAQRFRFGFTYDRSRFAAVPGWVPPDAAAANRTLAYPWIGYERIADGFITLRDFDRIQRLEDLNLGMALSARLGWSAPAFGADRSRLVFASAASEGWIFGPRQVLLSQAALSGRLRGGAIENGVASAGLRWYVQTIGNGLLVLKASGDLAENLDFENQLLLGGDNGLRGYPLRYQAGDRRFLVTVEQRFYGSREWFHLVNLGAAVFVDAGRAWFVEPPPAFVPPAGPGRGVLEDAGAGLRLGSSRSATGAVVHLDLAFPWNRGGSIRALQFLVTTSQTF